MIGHLEHDSSDLIEICQLHALDDKNLGQLSHIIKFLFPICRLLTNQERLEIFSKVSMGSA